MKNFAFISRHEPTAEQHALADGMGISLHSIGDADAFTVTPAFVDQEGAFEGVIVVHPAAAMQLCGRFLVGVFRNENRAPVGAPPKFLATELVVWDMRN